MNQGSVAGGYIAILAITGQWQTLLGVALVTVLTLSVLRGIILRVVALPRSAVFVLAVLTGSLITVALLALTPYIQAMNTTTLRYCVGLAMRNSDTAIGNTSEVTASG